jgi:acyl-lipid omega-6 desaturase (Delta-12 desaturase)
VPHSSSSIAPLQPTQEPSDSLPAGGNARPESEGPYWRDAVAPYARASLPRGVFGLLTSVVPYLALSALMYASLGVSYWLTLVLALPAAGFLVRTYIVFHDCTHGSFLPSRVANRWLGTTLGLLVFADFRSWKHNHAMHHASAGDLDRRGAGDVPTLTVTEYHERPWRGRLAYRLFRNPLVMFGIGPIFGLVIAPRIVPSAARPRIRHSVVATNVALAVLVAALCWGLGWRAYLLIELPTILFAGAAGIWLFYVQHQFEDAYWENSENWSYADAALRGSSYLKLPKVLQFFSGNIGLHHVHHLSARIPNYNLQRAHDENPIFHEVPVISLADGLRAVKLKLYDEGEGRMVTFAQARRDHRAAAPRPSLTTLVQTASSPREGRRAAS